MVGGTENYLGVYIYHSDKRYCSRGLFKLIETVYFYSCMYSYMNFVKGNEYKDTLTSHELFLNGDRPQRFMVCPGIKFGYR